MRFQHLNLKKKWWLRRESNSHTRKDTRFSSHFGFCRPPEISEVRGLDYALTLALFTRFRSCPSSLYTFQHFRFGLARRYHLHLLQKGFTEFEQFYVRYF
jgi:hypothetical protein